MSEKRGRGRPRRAGADHEILAATLELLQTHGYPSLTVEAVAERVGVAKTTIYRRWPSKGALVATAISPMLECLPARHAADVQAEATVLLRQVKKLLSSELAPVLAALIGEAQSDPTLHGVIAALFAPQRQLLREAISRGLARGELRPDTDAELVVDLLLAPFWTKLLLRQPSFLHPGEVVSLVMETMMSLPY